MINLVVPVYNEEDRFVASYWGDIIAIPNVRVLFVIDGATDDSYTIFSNLVRESVHEVLMLPKNVGKAEAVRLGFCAKIDNIVENDLVGFMDADPAFNVDDLKKFFQLTESLIADNSQPGTKYDSVWASRVDLRGRNIKRTAKRHYIGRFINTCLSLFIPSIPYDTQCGLKVFRNSFTFKEILEKSFRTKWFIDLELLLRWNKLAPETPMKIWEEPLGFWADVSGSSLSLKSGVRVLKEMVYIINEAKSKPS